MKAFVLSYPSKRNLKAFVVDSVVGQAQRPARLGTFCYTTHKGSLPLSYIIVYVHVHAVHLQLYQQYVVLLIVLHPSIHGNLYIRTCIMYNVLPRLLIL